MHPLKEESEIGYALGSDLLVSVIMPVYNVFPYLAEAIDSVLHQTYENIELVIINDGSTDGSADICDDYALKDKRVSVVHQRNLGLSAARNKGLDMIRGELVAFIDSDDAVHQDYIMRILVLMISDPKNPCVSLLISVTYNDFCGRIKLQK